MTSVNELKKQFPSGTRVRIIDMYDEKFPVTSGTKGTVHHVDDIGTVHVKWDGGRLLGLIPDKDKYEIIKEETNAD